MDRQVPEIIANSNVGEKPIAIVGNGKVARHMMHYFAAIGQPYIHWFRQQPAVNQTVNNPYPSSSSLSKFAGIKQRFSKLLKRNYQSLENSIEQVTKVLLLINDDQIESFIKDNPILNDKTLIHFSGSLHTELAIGCHPLMTFGVDLYSLEEYKTIPFVLDKGVNFKQLFPRFTNPVHFVNNKHRIKYHALCVMAGNFTRMLWQTIGEELEDMDLPADVMSQYLLQNTVNFINNPYKSATGPLVRGDYQTIKKHQDVLSGQSLEAVYESFIQLHHHKKSGANPEITKQRRLS